ncbi:hypothetical protein [Lelliottia jeotgali]
MASSKATRRGSETFERRVRELLAAGYSAAAIAKATGKSYLQTSRIVARIQQENS